MSRCVLTGCRLVLVGEGRSLWGDLHSLDGGKTCVFNGNRLKDGETAAWDYSSPFPWDSGEKQIRLFADSDYYEKRAIVTFERSGSEFNDSAKRYLGGGDMT